ncbi:hypothetical protein D3C77_318460 [compost metagenome]
MLFQQWRDPLALEQIGQLHRVGIQGLPTGKRQQAMGHAGGTAHGLLAQIKQLGQRLVAALLDAFADQFEAPADARQQVIEVVGDAAGQLADGFHLLGLAQVVLVFAQLAQLLFHPALQAAQRQPVTAGLVLAAAGAQRGVGQGQQRARVERAGQQEQVAQGAVAVLGGRLQVVVLAGQQDHGQVGPVGLLAYVVVQGRLGGAIQNAVGNDGQPGTLAQRSAQFVHGLRGQGLDTRLVEQVQGQPAQPGGCQDQCTFAVGH